MPTDCDESTGPADQISWRPIGHTSRQLILYHPASHAVCVRPDCLPNELWRPANETSVACHPVGYDVGSVTRRQYCPSCSQPLNDCLPHAFPSPQNNPNYFSTLELVHSNASRSFPAQSETCRPQTTSIEGDSDIESCLPTKGYYARFFKEVKQLGMGAEGSVYLAVHHIDGDVLGTYAVKKVAVGHSKSYLHHKLREVKLLEALRHPNIIAYHHAWIDMTRFSELAPPVPSLHVLMMYASGGNLDRYLLARLHVHPPGTELAAEDIGDFESFNELPKAERIKAFKRRKQRIKMRPNDASRSTGSEGLKNARHREAGVENRGVLLLGIDEILALLGDVVEGLSFLHANAILHLDLKCSNVLLHLEEGKIIPRALISDFGTSEEMLRGQRERTGHTGTLEYMAPETLVFDSEGRYRPSDSHVDMWSIGMILYKMLFLRSPYKDTENYSVLRDEILSYPGFVPDDAVKETLERRNIPTKLVELLMQLLNVSPEKRPSAEKIRMVLLNMKGHPENTKSRSATLGRSKMYYSQNPYSLESNPQSILDSKSSARTTRLLSALPMMNDESLPESLRCMTRLTKCQITRIVLLFIKIISIQRSITGVDLPPAVAAIMIALAVTESAGGYQESGIWSLFSLVVHCMLLICFAR
ncbi:IKS protein kinase [Cryptococcus neoformans 125.91]|uniref:IKS1 n=1 Tax=Cryptococcus neoformans TaxID=5207 RepID=Q5NKM3_CRYNE|nr:IKS1 [Cryptococcus neoformans var. grubii]OWZ58489.1 IKS protein kinase [Cryptococcus neoformans var. grubii 125.91]OXM79140.1 IKS protein kinase [Cryptococcus neoformans var. grubii Bt63]